MILKQTRNLSLTLFFALASLWTSIGLADDSVAPCWRGTAGTTYQDWSFAISNNPAAPDSFTNPNGTPVATMEPGPFATGWNANVLNRNGVWDMGQGGSVNLSIPNAAGLVWKYVNVQVTVFDDGGIYVTPTVSIPGATLVSSQVVSNETVAFGVWRTLQSVWLFQPSPAAEGVSITVDPSKGLLIDEIIVDTRNASAGDGDVAAYRPCWRGQAHTTFQQWLFGVSNTPAGTFPELSTSAYGTAQATVFPNTFSDGWVNEDPFLGCRQGFWDLGQSGAMNLSIPNDPAAPSGGYKYVQLQLTQFRDGLYNQNAAVSLPGATLVTQQETLLVTNGFGGQWIVQQTVWRLGPPCPASETIFISGGTNGTLIDQAVVDTICLDFSCPTDILVNADLGQCSKSNVTWSLPVVNGCTITNVTSSSTNGSTFPVGTNLVTSIIQDGEGGVKVCSFNVVVRDTQPPTVICPGDMLVGKTTNCGAYVTFTSTSVDNCPGAVAACVPPSGSFFPMGITTVSCTATDASGNVSSPCFFTVRVADFTGDSFSPCYRGQTNTTFQQWAFSVSNNPAALIPELKINPYGTPTASISPGPFSDGYINSDPFLGCVQGIWDLGQAGTMTLNIPNAPSSPPSAFKYVRVQVTQFRSSLYTQNVAVAISGATIVSQQQSVVATNNSGGQWISEETVLKAGPPCPTSETIVLTGGTFGSLIDQVVVDTLCLNLPCPPNITANADPGQCSKANVTWTLPAVNGCTVLSVTSNPTNGSTFATGTNLVTSKIVDAEGATNTCSFLVIINLPLSSTNTDVVNVNVPDGSPIGLASTMSVSTPIGSLNSLKVRLVVSNGFNGDLYAYLAHNSGFTVLLNRVGKTIVDPFGYGDPGFSVTFDDTASNGDVHVYRQTLFGNPLVPIGGPLTGTWAPDGRNVDPSLVVDTDQRNALLGSFNGVDPNGQWTLFVADMVNGDVSKLVSWSLEMQGAYASPVITNQPANVTVECSHNASFHVTATGSALGYQWYFGSNPLPNATNATLTISNAHPADAGGYFVVVTNNVCTFSGSATSQVAVLTVHDATPPVIACPTNITVNADTGICGKSNVTWVVTANDVCEGPITVVSVPPIGSTFPVGTTTVTCTATDSSTNTALCQFTVTVRDLQPPQIVCPTNIYAGVAAGQCSVPVNFTINATDNCSVTNIVSVPASGSSFPIGTTHVVSTATDASGNSNSCAFDVVVLISTTNTDFVNVAVPDGSPIGLTSTMNVSTPIGSITNLKVNLLVTNGYNGDLYAYLVHNSGFSILLNRPGKTAIDPFGYGDPGFNVKLDDSAPQGDIHNYRVTLFGNPAVPVGGPLTGAWAPDARNVDPSLVLDTDPRTAPLGAFAGADPNGQWTLFVADMAGGDVSTLVSWGLEIQGSYAPPVITNQPQNLTVECTHNASFHVTALGSALGYQWYYGTTPIPYGTNSILMLTNVHPSDSGGYFVVVTNVYCTFSGSKTSQVAILTVQDTTLPIIAGTSATESQLYLGVVNLKNCASNTVQGVVNISVQASDSCSPLSPPVVNLTNATANASATFVNQSPPGTFNYAWTVTSATSNGTWVATVIGTDSAANAIGTNFTLCVNVDQITGQVQLQNFVGTAVTNSRLVTFVASAGATVLKTWTLLVTNGSGATFNYTLIDVPPTASGVSAKTDWNLRRKLAVTLDSNGQGVANFTGGSLLLGGDIDASHNNFVNLGDYSVLAGNWFKLVSVVPAAAAADMNGDGIVNILDYSMLAGSWFQTGDPQ